MDGYGANAFMRPHPGCKVALTLRDIQTGQMRLAVVEGWRIAVIEGEPSTIDLKDRPEAARRLSRYAWARPVPTGIYDHTGTER